MSYQDSELTYGAFVQHAVQTVSEKNAQINIEALRMVLTLSRSSNLVSGYVRQALDETPFSAAGYRICLILYVYGKISMTKVTELSGMTRAAVSSACRTLAADKMIASEPCSNDTRRKNVSLTSQGYDAFQQAQRSYNSREQVIARRLSSEDIDQLCYLLYKIADL